MTSDRLHSTTEDGVMREDVTTEYGAESKNERVLETGSYLQLVLRLATASHDRYHCYGAL